MTKKHLLFELNVCMCTVWQFLEIPEFREVQTRKIDISIDTVNSYNFTGV